MAEREHESRRALADYAAGALRGRQARRVEGHLRQCPRCRAELARLRETAALVESAPLEEPPQRVDEAVRAYVAAHPRPVWARRGLRLAAAAVGVALLVAVGSWVGLRGTEPPLATVPYDAEMSLYVRDHAVAEWGAPFADRVALSAVILAQAQEANDAP